MTKLTQSLFRHFLRHLFRLFPNRSDAFKLSFKRFRIDFSTHSLRQKFYLHTMTLVDALTSSRADQQTALTFVVDEFGGGTGPFERCVCVLYPVWK